MPDSDFLDGWEAWLEDVDQPKRMGREREDEADADAPIARGLADDTDDETSSPGRRRLPR